MLDLPRSAQLALWSVAVAHSDETLAAASRAVAGDDDLSGVTCEPEDPSMADLPALIARVASAVAQHAEIRVVLPEAGDLLGLPGPPEFNRAAEQAGECVIVGAGPGEPWLGIIPEVTEFGSDYEPGALVTWRVYPVNPHPVTVIGSVAEASRELRTALMDATDTLTRLDAASWKPDAGAAVENLNELDAASRLPRAIPSRAAWVITTALRVRAIIEVATQDDGGALTSYEAQQRHASLRSLSTVARRALAAASSLQG